VDQIGVSGGNTVAEKRVDFSYHVDGRYDAIARYNDTAGGSGDEIATSTYSHDSLGRLSGLDYEQGSTDLFTPYSWSYDFLGRITQFTSADGTTDYEYDKTDQLTAADHDYQTDESYSYDANGNRTNTGYTTGDDNRLTNDGTFSYTYDDLNGVSSDAGGNVVLDFVDPDGDGSTSIALERRQLFGNAVDQILAQEDVTVSASSADRVYWPLVDHLGTVRDLVENDGALSEHYQYDSFGNVTSGDTSLTRYLYTSREFDPDTGLQHNRARWYDAVVGRWISEDPIGFAAGDTNLSRYVAAL
jgi:RHS repeat-associated protein